MLKIKIGMDKQHKNNSPKANTWPPARPLQGNRGNGEYEQGSRRRVEAVLAELDKMVGLEAVKNLVKELRAFVEIQQRRRREGLVTASTVMHMIFKGNPGTGKSTVARLMGRLFKEMGVLSQGQLVEVERADLVGEYIGHTAHKAREQLKKAVGGILFIDEAYSLARGGEKDFGREAIDVLVKGMEDYRDNLILILAGYREEMDYFLETNPGLRSRFPIQLDFPDYTVPELLAIARVMLAERQYVLSIEAAAELERLLRREVFFGHRYNGNARMVRNIIERAIRRQALRLVDKRSLTRGQLMTIEKDDLMRSAPPVKTQEEGGELSPGPPVCYNNSR
ncbi:AAA family ATPase [Moorella sp. Hama-1]|uniref:AAA family ATPase n=1 Tax=Moorella sp. Hama-1 TaxID=2138101 RepID=UPI000D650979|nr:AAA family ATPase [Moorella sp. Hama-1]MDN5361436.1 stage sporulation protein [Moorella sp. (in: firmicutes)]BCV21206.1 stage V sporulation protein K [Moorella sp. Hama-1]